MPTKESPCHPPAMVVHGSGRIVLGIGLGLGLDLGLVLHDAYKSDSLTWKHTQNVN